MLFGETVIDSQLTLLLVTEQYEHVMSCQGHLRTPFHRLNCLLLHNAKCKQTFKQAATIQNACNFDVTQCRVDDSISLSPTVIALHMQHSMLRAHDLPAYQFLHKMLNLFFVFKAFYVLDVPNRFDCMCPVCKSVVRE